MKRRFGSLQLDIVRRNLVTSDSTVETALHNLGFLLKLCEMM